MDSRDQTMRIVLVGKTGVGKSAAGNTIVRRRAFKSTTSAGSVTSECQKERVVFQCKQLEVVDTPGLYDTKDKEEAMREVAKCISYSAPGPHVFLVVLQLNRFTEEEQKTVKIIQKLFGKEAAHYTLVLFTRGDDLEVDGVTAEQFISENPELHEFILQCHGRYHVFNNRDKNPSQVTNLLEKINTMVQKNGGSCYTNEMLKEAERAIEEEKKKIQRERDITLEEARALAEKNNEFIQALMKLHFDSTARDPFATDSGFGSRIAIGAATGALAGLVGGPVGVGLGMVLGATVGTLAGLVDVVREECVIQ